MSMAVLKPVDHDNVPRNRLARRGVYGTRTRLYLSDRTGRLVDVIEDGAAVSGVVDVNEDVDVTRRCTLEVSRPSRFDALNTFIVVEIERTDADGHVETGYYGHYILTPPTTTRRPARVAGAFQAQDITYILTQQTLEGSTYAAGLDTGDVARSIALDAGFELEQLDIPPTGVLLSSAYTPDPGVTRFSAMTKVLNDSGFYKPTSTGRGVISTQRYRNLQLDPVQASYSTTEDDDRLLDQVVETPDLSRLKTKVIVRNLSPDRPPIYGVARITNQEHPLYASKSGLEYVETIDNTNVTTTEEATELARAALSETASYYRKVAISTVLDITAQARDIIELTLVDGLTVNTARWWRRAWKVQLRGATATTESELYRVEEWQ